MAKHQIAQMLLGRLPPDHAATPTMREAITAALAVAERFEAFKTELERNDKLSPVGKIEATKEALTKAARDLVAAGKPVAEAGRRAALMREAIATPIDQHDVVGEMRRAEIRATLAEMPPAKRAPLVLSDAVVAEAVLGAPAIVSGLPGEVYAQLAQAQTERLHGPRLREVEALEAVVSEAAAGVAIARGELGRAGGLDARVFEAVVGAVEKKGGEPLLVRDGDQFRRVVPGSSTYPVATPDEVRHGRVIASHAEYLAATAGPAVA